MSDGCFDPTVRGIVYTDTSFSRPDHRFENERYDSQCRMSFQDELDCIRTERLCHRQSFGFDPHNERRQAAIELATALMTMAIDHAWQQLHCRAQRVRDPRPQYESRLPHSPRSPHDPHSPYEPSLPYSPRLPQEARLPSPRSQYDPSLPHTPRVPLEQRVPDQRDSRDEQSKRSVPAEQNRPSDRKVEAKPIASDTASGTAFELHNLKYSTGKHKTPDAIVYVPQGFDASKPIRVVVYNHGLSTDVKEAFKNSQLQQQLSNADPNTIFIVPEWQTQPQTRLSGDNDRFHQKDFFKNMLDEVFAKTPALSSKTSKDIDSIGIITHSGGYKATMSQMYNNGLYDKVTSLAVLDSMYNPKGFDRWISDNIHDLAAGKKHLLVVYTDHLSTQSNGLADRIAKMLKEQRIADRGLIIKDKSTPNSVVTSDVLRNNGIVFKYSTLKTAGRDSHNAMTGLYVREVINSEQPARQARPL